MTTAFLTDRVYPHDFASVPVDWGQVAGRDLTSGQLVIRKDGYITYASDEFFDDYGAAALWDLIRTPTWEEQLAALVHASRPDRRLRRVLSDQWAAFRRRLAYAIYPEHEWD